ncbi:MAG: GNAT family N-acetyltransferase [bacterium]
MSDEDRARFWEDRYSQSGDSGPAYDDWAERIILQTPDVRSVLELGCGTGRTSAALHRAGLAVVATDVAPSALERAREQAPGMDVRHVDLTEPLPFADGSFSVVVADLCLHYFDSATTHRVLAEIERVLAPDGLLLARVNSYADSEHGAGRGRELEPGFFEHDGHCKRFFTEPMIRGFLTRWRELAVRRREIHRYRAPKDVYEIVARRPDPNRRAGPIVPAADVSPSLGGQDASEPLVFGVLPEAELCLIEPLWTKLNDHHRTRAGVWSDYFARFTFAERAKRFRNAEKTLRIHVVRLREDGPIRGYCISSIDPDGRGEIESIYVDEELRGRGAGHALVERALAWLSERGVSDVSIVVAVGNEEALPFYERLGFAPRTYRLERLPARNSRRSKP